MIAPIMQLEYQYPPDTGRKGSIYGEIAMRPPPLCISLRKYTPVPKLQQCESCVGWACAYESCTTMWAYANNVTNKDSITNNAYDPMYLYGRISKDCNSGSDILAALRYMQNDGIPVSKVLVSKNMVSTDLRPDELLKIAYYNRIFELNSDSTNIVDATRESLRGFFPVVVVGIIDDNFQNLTVKNSTWVLKKGKNSSNTGHAMCVIGCDDITKKFEIMNSWGTDWGDHGYFFISYKDFWHMVRYAFQIQIPMNHRSVNNIMDIAGDMEIDKNSAASRSDFKEIKPVFQNSKYYILDGLNPGDTYKFQLLNLKSEKYTYLITINSNKPAVVLYSSEKTFKPGKMATITPQGHLNNVFVTPLNADGSSMAKSGNYQYCILYAATPIAIDQVVQQLNQHKGGNKTDELNTILRDRLVPFNIINYRTGDIHADGHILTGDVIPINFFINI